MHLERSLLVVHARSFVASLCLTLAGLAHAADWPPTLDDKNTVTRGLDGRAIERYTHGPRESWGYPRSAASEWAYAPGKESGPKQQNHNSFYLVAPKQPRPHAPLGVVLHSANRTAYEYLAFGHLGGNATVATRLPDDFYALYLSSTNAEWWGWKERQHVSPAEKRLLDTIEWVVTKCGIDRNRIYLCGVSMGGCGTLAIGMPHGDVFAAIRATVPAGTEYAAARLGGFPAAPPPAATPAVRDAWLATISAAGLPDPPVVVDFSAQNDNWSKTQPALIRAAEAGRLPLVLGWGPFHHPTFDDLIAKYALCRVALAYPWQEIRKNAAYPVFTHATTNQRSPWQGDGTAFDESGQFNAWFRWKNVEDTPRRLALQLWLAHPEVKDPPPMPDTATADVTLRRLQQFAVQPGTTYAWQWTRAGKTLASGQITLDAAHLLTVPGLSMSTTSGELVLIPQGAPSAGDQVKLEPGATITLEFPELPETFYAHAKKIHAPAMLTAQLPRNYSPAGRFPLFVFLQGGNGGPGNDGTARRIVGDRDFIAVSMPLFKDKAPDKLPVLPGIDLKTLGISLNDLILPSDAAKLGAAYRVMLQKLADVVPNLDPQRSALGGFSNGAHATAALMAAKDDGVLRHFRAFCLVEGGVAIGLTPSVLADPVFQGCRMISIFGDTDLDPRKLIARKLVTEPCLTAVAAEAAKAHLSYTRIAMPGRGHTFPPEYQKALGCWLRGEKLPEVK